MPLVATRGAASAQGFGEFAQPAAPATYIEDVFSTYLYTGTGANRTITNGIDLSAKGGLIWTKFRSGSFGNEQHSWNDSVRGLSNYISSDSTAAQVSYADTVTGFTTSGYTLGADASGGKVNYSAQNYASWAFAEQPKFFDIVTYTGNATNRTIAHNLGSVPGMIIVKCASAAGYNWVVYHRSLGATQNLVLQTTAAAVNNGAASWNSTAPTSTEFSIGTSGSTNANGETFVAYLFAHDAGGFGTAGTDNVISCGSFTTDGSGNATVSLGYEPQYLMFKSSSATGNWFVADVMRGFSLTSNELLQPNTSGAEFSANWGNPTATGFTFDEGNLAPSTTFIYMAIRRGPMKTPTSGTTVFQPVRYAGNNTNGRVISTGKTFPTDWLLTFDTENGASGSGTSYNSPDITRLAGFGVNPPYLRTNSTNAESAAVNTITLNNSNFDYTVGSSSGQLNSTGANYTNWNFGRAPGFFDVVCYTGNDVAGRTLNHNLAAVPELMIVKARSAVASWRVYTATTGNGNELIMNTTDPSGATANWDSTTPTSSVFSLGGGASVNASGTTYVAYLFATVAGVSKVGSYIGTGSTQTINCGFTGGARFVLIKRTDSTGDWWAWDTAFGMVAGNDTRIAINQTAQIINQNWVYTITTGFQIVTTNAAVNASGGSYIFLAIA